jgi:predicted outer membrane repeat protein
MSMSPVRLFAAAAIAVLVAAAPRTAHAQVTTVVSSSGQSVEFGNVSADARKTVAIAGRSRVVDVDVRFDADAGCDGAMNNSAAPIAHPRVGDFTVTLFSPQGTAVTLSAQRGGARDNFCTVRFDDDGGFASIATLTSVNGQPVSGSFAPDNPLSAFDGEDPNGGWTLRVADLVSGTSGHFNRFTLELQTAAIEDILVDVLDDPAPGGCTPGSCSLREAVLLANARPGLDRIVLPTGELQLARAGADEDANDTGDLDVHDSLEIVGQGAEATRLLQLAADRVLHNVDSPELTVRGLTLSGGRNVALGGAVRSGGRFVAQASRFESNRASYRGGAIFHAGQGIEDWPIRLELIDSHFIGNRAEVGSEPAAYGGALYVLSSGFQANHGLIDGCTFSQNEADNGGGAIALGAVQSVSGTGHTIRDTWFEGNQTVDGGHGGAVGTNLDENGIVQLTVLDSTFIGNVASGFDPDDHRGGAIRVRSGQLKRLANSLFTDNEAAFGGAVDLNDALGLIEDSSFSFNRADHAGGAIHAANTLTINRSTLNDNSVASTDLADAGGGGLVSSGNTLITRSTFDNNSALRGGAITATGGNLSLINNTLTTTGSNLPAGADATILRYLNTNASHTLGFYGNIIIGRCLYSGGAIVPDTASYNIEASGNTCRFGSAPLPVGNKIAQAGAAVMLGPLGDNGGPTATRLPVAPSIAIDAAGNLGCPPIDQRGYVRSDASCDIGAVEASGLPLATSVFRDGFES